MLNVLSIFLCMTFLLLALSSLSACFEFFGLIIILSVAQKLSSLAMKVQHCMLYSYFFIWENFGSFLLFCQKPPK